MALVTRTLSNNGSALYTQDGILLPNVKITFTLIGKTGVVTDAFDAISHERVLPEDQVTYTDANGEFSINLWANSRSTPVTYYACVVDYPRVPVIYGIVPEGAEDFSWLDFKLSLSTLTITELSALGVHLEDYTKHITATEREALTAAAPSAINPLATKNDLLDTVLAGTDSPIFLCGLADNYDLPGSALQTRINSLILAGISQDRIIWFSTGVENVDAGTVGTPTFLYGLGTSNGMPGTALQAKIDALVAAGSSLNQIVWFSVGTEASGTQFGIIYASSFNHVATYGDISLTGIEVAGIVIPPVVFNYTARSGVDITLVGALAGIIPATVFSYASTSGTLVLTGAREGIFLEVTATPTLGVGTIEFGNFQNGNISNATFSAAAVAVMAELVGTGVGVINNSMFSTPSSAGTLAVVGSMAGSIGSVTSTGVYSSTIADLGVYTAGNFTAVSFNSGYAAGTFDITVPLVTAWTDAFNVDMNPVTVPWVAVSGVLPKVVSGQLKSTVSTVQATRYSSMPASIDQYVQATVGSTSSAGVGLVVRASSTANTYYVLEMATTNSACKLYAYFAGSTYLLKTPSGNVAVGDTVRLEIRGYSFTATKNGSAWFTYTDTNAWIPGAGQPGVWFAGATQYIDNFGCGLLISSGSISTASFNFAATSPSVNTELHTRLVNADMFNSTGGTSLGIPWVGGFTTGALPAIYNNTAVGPGVALYSSFQTTGDQFVKLDSVKVAPGSSTALILKSDVAARNEYKLEISSTAFTILKSVNNVWSTLAAAQGGLADGTTIQFEIVGDTLHVLINDSPYPALSVTDNSPLTDGYVGFGIQTWYSCVDNFSCGVPTAPISSSEVTFSVPARTAGTALYGNTVTMVSDTFDRAPSSTLGTDWQMVSGITASSVIDSTGTMATSATGFPAMYWVGSGYPFSSNHWIEGRWNSDIGKCGGAVRMSTNAASGVTCYYCSSAGDIVKSVNGAHYNILPGSYSGTLKLQAVGTSGSVTLSLYQAGVQIATVTDDGTLLGSGSPLFSGAIGFVMGGVSEIYEWSGGVV